MDFYNAYERRGQYIHTMRPILIKEALYSDLTKEYVIPQEPAPYSMVKIRFRTSKNNVDYVFLMLDKESHLMRKVLSDQQFDYYEQEVMVDQTPLLYQFRVQVGRQIVYYDQIGSSREVRKTALFRIIPGFQTPEWAKGAVMYQIFVDRFCNGDPSNDVLNREYYYLQDYVHKVEDWHQTPAKDSYREFYGGDLQGVISKLDYLQGLGIEAIYFNPLFVSPSSHKYDIQDYDNIDPHFGVLKKDEGEVLLPGDKENLHATKYISRVTSKENLEASNTLFIRLVEEAHKRGMKVILDGVFNHCGSFNKWLDREQIYAHAVGYEKGAYAQEESPYQSYFRFVNHRWPNNNDYEGWWGHPTLPKLNYEARALYDYILRVAAKWVSPPYNADGWRLDVAADLGFSVEMNHRFWKDFRKAVKQANPEALILAEHYGNPTSWLKGDEWDSVMNYDAFMEPVTWFLTGMQKHSDDYRPEITNQAAIFMDSMQKATARMPYGSIEVAMNELSNHDHSRFLTRTNHVVGRVDVKGAQAAQEGIRKDIFREAVVMQMTWTGAPTIYYGDEAGLCGFTDPDNRRPYPWGKEDQDLIRFHKDMIRIRKENQELRRGSLMYLHQEEGILAYARFMQEGQTVVLINNLSEQKEVSVTVWMAGIPRDCTLELLLMSDANGYDTDLEGYPVIGGVLKLEVPGNSAMVLNHKPILDLEL